MKDNSSSSNLKKYIRKIRYRINKDLSAYEHFNYCIEGNYILLNIPVGTYDITISMIGYRKQVMKDVEVIMDKTIWMNISLPVSRVEGETITVTGERELVEKGTTSKKITVSSEAIESLPIRDISELYSLQSGVVKVESRSQSIPDHEERGLEEVHVRGGRSGEIAYMIDGLYIRNPIFGGIGSGTRLNLFAVQEFDWQPGGFNAEYGDAMSAVSNMHTNSGSDEFTYKFKYETSTVGSAMGSKYDELRGYNDYNYGFGGPLPFLDKFTFWTSGQYTDNQSYRVLEFDDNVFVDDDQGNDQNRENLVQPWDREVGFRGFGFKNTWDIFTKIAYRPSNKLRMNISYWTVASHQKTFNPRYMYWDDGQNELFRDTDRITAEWNHSLTPKTFYSIRISRFTQKQFQGVRWMDSDSDGYPDWYEWRHPAGIGMGSGQDIRISDPYNPDVVPYTLSENGDTVYYTMKDENSGWFHGAKPGNYNWAVAENFTDMNGNGIYDAGDSFSDADDLNGNGQWDGPEIAEECYYRDGSYWLTPEMYESYANHYDYLSVWHEYEQDPWWGNNMGFYPFNSDSLYFLPTSDGSWLEGSAFGGHDIFYGESRAVTQEYRFDITSQLTDKWKVRSGLDLKSHKLNFYEVKYPWQGAAAFTQTFAEFWDDTGPDGLLPGDEGYEEADPGEGNRHWDEGEEYDDANGNGEWDDFREPMELSTYIQNVFEVPWMVINAGVRLDAVNYNTAVWADPDGNPSPNAPYYFADIGEDGQPNTGDPGENDDQWNYNEPYDDNPGFAQQKVMFTDAKWFYKVSPRLGFSHVITDQATFTFNYGIYYQTPRYAYVYLNTSRLEDPEELFEESEGELGNATMNAERAQMYEWAFNIQMNRYWAFSMGAWVKNTDQMVTAKINRSGVYEFYVFSNGDYGSAKGIDFTLQNRGMLINTMLQYTYSVAKANREYPWQSVGSLLVDAPSQEYLAYYDRTHDLTLSLYTMLPFGIMTSLTGFYQSGAPYTPLVFDGDKPRSDDKNPNSKRAPAYNNINLSFSKYVNWGGTRVSLGMNVYNLINQKNAIDIWPLTGKPDDPGEYYLDEVGLPIDGGTVSGSYYDQPWYYSSPRQVNFFVRMDL